MRMVTICLCSYNAPERLCKSLIAIGAVRSNTDAVFLNYAGDNESAYEIFEHMGNLPFAIRNPERVGFSKAYNALLVKAVMTGDNILLMSDDAEPIGDSWLRELEIMLGKDPTIGAIIPFELYRNDEGHVMAFSPIDGHEISMEEVKNLKETYDLTYCNCSIVLFRREALVKVGLFDENYSPAYWDDSDLGIRMWLAGYRSVLFTGIKFYHQRGMTIPRSFYPSRQAQYHNMKWKWLIDDLSSKDLLPKLQRIAKEGLPAILEEV
jgi:GT2 family glycosyltransferase